MGLAGCGSNYPEGVDTDAFEVRYVTWSYGDYEVLTYDDKHFVLPAEGTEVYELADSGRDFLSRDEKTLWLKGDTVDRLGLENLEVVGQSAASSPSPSSGSSSPPSTWLSPCSPASSWTFPRFRRRSPSLS